jgi:hypothetical protein
MEKIKFTTTIDAPPQVVWNTMLNDATYREWTSAFSPRGSWYEGNWAQGSTIRFLGAGEDGKPGGMVSRVKENRPYEYVSVEHLGMIHDGQEDTTSDEVKKWAGALENYTFIDKNGRTELRVDMDVDEGHRQMFEEMWPRALERLKTLAEQ